MSSQNLETSLEVDWTMEPNICILVCLWWLFCLLIIVRHNVQKFLRDPKYGWQNCNPLIYKWLSHSKASIIPYASCLHIWSIINKVKASKLYSGFSFYVASSLLEYLKISVHKDNCILHLFVEEETILSSACLYFWSWIWAFQSCWLHFIQPDLWFHIWLPKWGRRSQLWWVELQTHRQDSFYLRHIPFSGRQVLRAFHSRKHLQERSALKYVLEFKLCKVGLNAPKSYLL